MTSIDELIADGKRYGAILADPPWQFRTYNAKGRNRCPDWRPHKNASARHYEVMSLDDIKVLPVAQVAADDCMLFMWATWPTLLDAFDAITAWGFTYKTCGFLWAKQNRSGIGWHMGCGYYTRANTEPCLLATRGRPKRLSKAVRQLIVAPRRETLQKAGLRPRGCRTALRGCHPFGAVRQAISTGVDGARQSDHEVR
jgi:N6-adenosine-specific RNA methylase IME4